MVSDPKSHSSRAGASLEELLATATPGAPLSGALLRELRPTGVVGALAQMPLTEILQNMDFGKRSVRVDVWGDDVEGTVHVHDGQIVVAQASTSAGTTSGEDAVLEMCRRPGGFFRILYEREDVERNVHRPTTFVLLEALRVIDEATNGMGRDPADASWASENDSGDDGDGASDAAGQDAWADTFGTAPPSKAGPAAPPPVELGPGPSMADPDPWAESTQQLPPPPEVRAQPPPLPRKPAPASPFGADDLEDRGPSLNDASAVVDIEVAAEAHEEVVARTEHPRYRVGALINVFVAGATTACFLEDIGRGGGFLRTDTPAQKGSVVRLRLPSSDGAVEVPARVVHVLDRANAQALAREPGMGVRFENLVPDIERRLGAFVDELARAQGAGNGAPQSPRERLLGLVAESELLVAAGDLESAKRVLSQAQGLSPDDDHVRKKLHAVNEAIDAAQANTFLEQAMRGGPKAVELARRATQLRPVRDVLLRSLAVFVRGGAHDEVADVAEQLLELDPDDEGALRTLLDANIAMQRWEVAVTAAESLVRLRPNDDKMRQTLAKVAALARRG